MAAVSSTADLAAPSKRSRGLADIDPKFVSNSGLSGPSELECRSGSVRIQHRPPRHPSGSGGVGLSSSAGPVVATSASAAAAAASAVLTSRFPKLDECAHFHYDNVDLGPLSIQLYEENGKVVSWATSSDSDAAPLFGLQITSYGKSWILRRSYEHFRILDEQLHRCIYDRKFSQLPLLPDAAEVALKPLLSSYVSRLSAIAGNLINCAPVLNWLEVDNRGRRLYPPPPSDDADAEINTPAVAAAYAVRRYAAVASDEISFEVGDMISVIDMPPPEESMWWRGKRGFDVGFFPSESVRLIGDKVPAHLSLPGTPPPPSAMMLLHAGAASSSFSASGISSSPSPFKGHNISGGSSSGGGSSDHLPTKPVLRKHGKLISFFRSFILSRPSRRKLKQSGILKERVFGCDLGEHLLNSGREIPMVLKCCAEFIEEYGIVDGIYRLSGITSNIQKLRNAFDEDRIPALVEDEAIRQDMHAVSSLLKMYFRELPNPLCTYQLYDQFVNAVQGPDNLRVVRMREVVQQLPPPHFRTLEYLTRHLARVAENNASTGMTAKNVAIVWAPNLLRCKELEFGGVAALQGVGVQAVVTECLVRYVELIFSEKAPLVDQLSDDLGAGSSSGSGSGALKRTRPKSLAISTPTKLLSLEEARNRALQLASSQNDTQYIEVGGGPSSLPPKYHTVIELPGGHGGARRGNSLKHKKSPLGWKSLFAKPKGRSATGSNKAQRKASSASTSSTASMPAHTSSATQRAITYIRPRLRPVKSAESLVPSNRNSSAGENSTNSPAGAKALETVQLEASATALSPMREDSAIAAGEGDDESQDGTLSRCHNRSVSHDSYFRLMMSNRAASTAGVQHADTLDEESEVSPESSEGRQKAQLLVGDAIYAEISKPSTSRSKQSTPAAERARNQSGGQEFGRDMKLTSVEDPHSGSSKLSLNDLSHLDDSELNMMSSREMLASTTSANNIKSLVDPPTGLHKEDVKARRASIDDSIIDDSARIPMNAEQIDEKGNWAASNPAYELFCIQAEVHNHHLKSARSPSPDNTDAQMPDMPSEMAMDGDNDSLVNVASEDYSSTELAGSDEHESGTLSNVIAINDLYENVNVAENRNNLVDDSIKRVAASAVASAYENFAENQAYAMVRVACGVDPDPTTYENVIDPSIIDDEEYEPIQPPDSQPPPPPTTTTAVDVNTNVCYENIDQPSYENLDEPLASYENVDHLHQQQSYENVGAPQPSYENLDRPLAMPEEQPCYENVDDEAPVVAVVALVDPIDFDQSETYENVVLRNEATSSPKKPMTAVKPSLELVNVYEDVVPPPPKTAETEEIVYHQVKVLRQSIQEVNQLLRDDPTVLQMAIDATSPPPPPSPVKYPSSSPIRMVDNQEATKKKPIAKDSAVVATKPVELVIRDIAVDDALVKPTTTVTTKDRLSLQDKRTQEKLAGKQLPPTVGTNDTASSSTKDQLSLSLPSLLNSPKKSSPTSSATQTMTTSTTASPDPKTLSNSISSRSLPPTPLYEHRHECESISSKRRFESEIGRDLLRERRIRNEIESSRRSDGSPEGATSPLITSPSRRQSSSASSSPSSTPSNSSGRPALPVKTSPKRSVGSAVPPAAIRPTTLETSFDYEPSPLQRRASSPPSSNSPLSPVSPSSEGRNARKASVKELLNKFQTGHTNNELNDRSTRVTTPTSPIHKPPPTTQSCKVSAQSIETDTKINTKDGKENIEVHLVSLSQAKADVESMSTDHDSLDSNKSGGSHGGSGSDAAIEQDSVNELLRGHKSLSIGIDMSDPRTRLRIERYKEERRSFLREKYKSESFRNDSKEDGLIVRLKQKAGSPTHQPESNQALPPPSLQPPEPGLIDEDVNVKERAAQWAGQTVPASSDRPAAVLLPSPPATINRSCSEAASSAITPQQKRIRDMAALFEKESP